MINQSIIYEIAYKLDSHANSRRIKKLIFCASKNTWQNDIKILNQFKSSELLLDLYNNYPTIEHLNYTLLQIVNTLNKPEEYTVVANIILEELVRLYTKEEDTDTITYLDPEESTYITGSSQPSDISPSLVEELKNHQIKYEYNPFDLRQNIMKYTNPLRAKMVLFSALNNKFDFQGDDWFKLKQEEFDTLLRKLFDTCASFEELEFKLNNSIISLGDQDENIQSVGAILQFMRNLYGNIVCDPYSENNQYFPNGNQVLINSDYQTAPTDIDDFEYDDQDNTCQFVEPPQKYMFKPDNNQ
ncbi:MAG: hypothetical protein EAZ76_08210 [Nostocales cyanobacterium]|nr:MAG: hypothetical protein EAZ87_22055 [Nostocales cyanobacterium]TAF15826.1 MAG: hypothetical protein EAZ76_08210 [Nostocales cyanobacterium]